VGIIPPQSIFLRQELDAIRYNSNAFIRRMQDYTQSFCSHDFYVAIIT